MLRMTGIACETLLEDEENQIRGLVYVGDGQAVGLSYISLFTLKEAVRLVKNGEVIKSNFHFLILIIRYCLLYT